MTVPLPERTERAELQNKLNSGTGSERATAYPQESAFAPRARAGEPERRIVESSLASPERRGQHALRSSANGSAVNPRPEGTARSSEFYPAHVLHPRLVYEQRLGSAKRPLRVMKFGGTSVGDASSIERVVAIVRAAARESDVVVVVSAMSGVTNKLVEAATQSEAGNRDSVATIFKELRLRHEAAANALIRSADKRQRIARIMQRHLQEGERLCHDTILRRELTLRVRDAISGLGERLSAPLVAAALAEEGVASEAIDATELVVTNSCHGAAEPYMDLTRERCELRLRPLLFEGVVAVVTGFIGATVDGALTTLGRNSSDYSGTIMGAALDADEVTLWTDVDGILSADPRLVPGAYSILEMSYREASDLADSGAKVLHPKTLRALMQRGIPLAIRNTFAPDRPGTKITPTGSSHGVGVKVLTATNDVALITVRTSSVLEAPDILRRTLATAAAIPTDLRLAPQSSSSPNAVCIVVSAGLVASAVKALRQEFAQDLQNETVRDITFDPAVAIVTVVGEKMRGEGGLIDRVLGSLCRENLTVLASTLGASQSSVSFVVAQCDLKTALVTAHRELELSAVS
jgi:aspartokinase/homoserine dehydrogenase 1